MPKFLVEVEESTITSYEIEAEDANAAKKSCEGGKVVEKHDNIRIINCEEIIDD